MTPEQMRYDVSPIEAAPPTPKISEDMRTYEPDTEPAGSLTATVLGTVGAMAIVVGTFAVLAGLNGS